MLIKLKQMILQTTENSINLNHICLHHSSKLQQAKQINGNHTEVKFQDSSDPMFQNIFLKTASTHYSGQFGWYCDSVSKLTQFNLCNDQAKVRK